MINLISIADVNQCQRIQKVGGLRGCDVQPGRVERAGEEKNVVKEMIFQNLR